MLGSPSFVCIRLGNMCGRGASTKTDCGLLTQACLGAQPCSCVQNQLLESRCAAYGTRPCPAHRYPCQLQPVTGCRTVVPRVCSSSPASRLRPMAKARPRRSARKRRRGAGSPREGLRRQRMMDDKGLGNRRCTLRHAATDGQPWPHPGPSCPRAAGWCDCVACGRCRNWACVLAPVCNMLSYKQTLGVTARLKAQCVKHRV